ncbi:hypothetical protein ERO13_D05G354850v2 [Gossypium hirsutum]|nr:hypothetical protein ERO13_D05G354850v2 [Gossypium hirsutum]
MEYVEPVVGIANCLGTPASASFVRLSRNSTSLLPFQF